MTEHDERKRRQDRDRMRALRASRRAAGVCVGCAGPLPAGGYRCEECRAAAARQVAASRLCNRERGRCPRCGEQDFDRRWKQCGECRAKGAAVERARLARLREVGAGAL